MKTVKVRKRHVCDTCGDFIEKGELAHTYSSRVYSRGGFESFYFHVGCKVRSVAAITNYPPQDNRGKRARAKQVA